ncbi:MAG: PHB depolymerase family esterase [Pirellulales bacterium]
MRNRLDRSQETGIHLDWSKNALPRLGATETFRTELPLALFGPERYEPRYEYPLIVWLHSCHSNERELETVMPLLSLQNYVACAPRGTHASEACGHKFFWGPTKIAASLAEEIIFASVDAAMKQFSIARNRVFLAGFGSGGSMAMRIGLRYPRDFAGAISICGAFPQQGQPLSNLSDSREIPMLWMYGGQSKQCGVDHICSSLPLLHAARLSVDIRQYPCRDELLSNMLSDMNHWVMQQVTRQPTQPEGTVEESFSRN